MILDNKDQNGFIISTINVAEASVRNAEDFKQEIFGLIDSGQKHIILNFEKVEYIDSSFLGSLVAGLKHAIGNGADIYLVCLKSDIYDLLSLIRMNKVFKIYATPDEAIQSI